MNNPFCFVIVVFLLFIILFYLRKNISDKSIIVTGASSNHELSLIQFIYHCFNNNKNIILVVWDLGFSKNFKKSIISILKQNKYILYKEFNYSNYPSYFNININQRVYAWKPIIINITFCMMKKTILWLDSGCIITTSLVNLFYNINKYHCFSTSTSGNIKKWTHIGMIKYYNISNNITERIVCNGAIVGFKWNSNVSTAILNEWVECAYNINCIAPNGSSVKNHRQDQSALSILIYKYKIFYSCPKYKYNILTHKDLHNLEIAKNIYKKLIKSE